MRTEYTAHIDRKKDEYSIQFETGQALDWSENDG